MEKSILRKWLKAGYIEKKVFHLTEEGTPQGGIISPALANMVLDGLEKVLEERFGSKNSQAMRRAKVHLIRYADDVRRSQAVREETLKRVSIREKYCKAPTLSRPGNRLGSGAWWERPKFYTPQ
jgi:retron-type reverse transcriptase